MASKVIKGPFDGPRPKEPEDFAATFRDTRPRSLGEGTRRDAGAGEH